MSIIGLIFIMRGCIHPSTYQKELSKETTTAVRVTQVYTEATHIVIVGIGIVSLGILTAFIGILICTEEVKNLYLRCIDKVKQNLKDSHG
jgi:hypothetical protein